MTTRRDFLKGTAAAAVAAPLFVPQSAFGANDRITTGHIGLRNQGKGNLGRFLGNKQAQPVAVCDVDTKFLDAGAKAIVKKNSNAKPMRFGDYRKLLERKDIDAVVVSTPDHWHGLMTVDACNADKHVYCEKPLTLTIAEGRKMVEAARANKRIVQTGSQQRSASNFRTACELVRNGFLGKLKQVRVGIPGPNHPGKPVPDSEPPRNLDYDMWLGPAPKKPYNEKRVHYNFRFFKDYSGGQITNWGAHHLDIAQWGLGMDNSGPIAVEGQGDFHPQGWHEVTEHLLVRFTYANGVELVLAQGKYARENKIAGGTIFVGSEGKLYVNRGKLASDPKEIIKTDLSTAKVKLTRSRNHVGNFLECIKTGKLPICDVEIGHRSATVCHLANLAVEAKRKLKWDPKTERFVDDKDANEKLMRAYRKPWSLG